jgi:hypothetical protein
MTTTFCAVAAPIAMIFRVNDDLVSQALEGLTASELWHRPTDKNNPMLWLAGHVADTRGALLRILGEPFDATWGELFGRGSVLQEPARHPSVDEIKRVTADINCKLYAKLEALDDECLAQPAKGFDLPHAKTIADQLAFFALHDAYHVGQMGFVRKALGYPGLAG